MFTVLPSTRMAYSVFFVVFYFLVCMVVLNVVTALIIQGFAENQRQQSSSERESWVVLTRDGHFQIKRTQQWSHQMVNNALPAFKSASLRRQARESARTDNLPSTPLVRSRVQSLRNAEPLGRPANSL